MYAFLLDLPLLTTGNDLSCNFEPTGDYDIYIADFDGMDYGSEHSPVVANGLTTIYFWSLIPGLGLGAYDVIYDELIFVLLLFFYAFLPYC